LVRQDERRQETREKLVRAARELFEKQGFDATTVEEIVERAAVARSSFFRYFRSKTDIAFPDEQEQLAQFDALLRTQFDPDNPVRSACDALLGYARSYIADEDKVRREAALLRSSRLLVAQDAENDHAWEEVLARSLARGRLSEVEARVYAGAVFGAVRAGLRAWLAEGRALASYWDVLPPVLERLAEAHEQRNRLIAQSEKPRERR
jgi:AcrR family transcriptional regulator